MEHWKRTCRFIWRPDPEYPGLGTGSTLFSTHYHLVHADLDICGLALYLSLAFFMLNSPLEISQPESVVQYSANPVKNHPTQHGAYHDLRSSLLALPAESLTHITSFLDPWSLLGLSCVAKRFNEHVKDDNTWLRAFAYQYLGVGPESDLREAMCVTLRKSEPTWKREFILRYNIRTYVPFLLPSS